jgi:sarcosine oxidase subunit alpha
MVQRITSHAYLPLKQSEKEISFTYNGKNLRARQSDTIASALLAAGVNIFSRSFKYHRPRGLTDYQGQGAETLMTVDHAPNIRADKVLVAEGMVVSSQNAWPSPEFDVMAINDKLVPMLPNGFYYKMFHKPRWLWPIAEKQIRKVAGLGQIDTSGRNNNTRYEKRYRFPDVCVIGGGPAGLSAAKAALDQDKQVLIIDDEPTLGGHSRHTLTKVKDHDNNELNGLAEHEAVEKIIDSIKKDPKLEILTSTMVFAIYEDNLVAAQRGNELFKIRAEAVVVATGATDRHLVFEKNDKPGIMTGRAVERLIALHAICPEKKAVVITNHDGGYHSAKMLAGAGCEVVAVVDSRLESFNEDTFSVYYNETIHTAIGGKRVKAVTTGSIDGKKTVRKLDCDLVVIAVGFKPQLQLLSMGNARPQWDSERDILRVETLPSGVYAAGEINGTANFARLCSEGATAGLQSPSASCRDEEDNIKALPADIEAGGSKHFICKCMDVTRKEACASIKEGYDQVETLKRYSSMGMGPCQGKSCHEAVARLAAVDTGLGIDEAVATTVRPPYSPVSFGVLAGRAPHLGPVRRTPMHHNHIKAGATFLNAGLWKRPHHYVDPQDEARHNREKLGMIDVSTLGKIELCGPDVLDFLHFLFPGKYAKFAVGKTRYSAMIGEDGILFEDGTISHTELGRYYLSTTTGNQDAIVSLFWWWITTDGFDVQVNNLSAVNAAVNISGQRSREFLQSLVDINMSNEAFEYMACRKTQIANVPVWMFRIGFTGELSYELHYPGEYGATLWDYLLEKGKDYDLQPFGLEAQRILRLEKGHIIPGVDTDALSNPYEAGIGFTIKEDKKDFVGRAFLKNFKERGIENKLVPYKLQPGDPIPDDGVAVLEKGKITGRVSSSRMSPTLGCGIGLAWVKEYQSSTGSKIQIRLATGKDVIGKVLDHAAFDPQGERLKS